MSEVERRNEKVKNKGSAWKPLLQFGFSLINAYVLGLYFVKWHSKILKKYYYC